MPFKTVCIKDEIEKQRENDPAFRKAWDDSRAEYELIGQMIRLSETGEHYTETTCRNHRKYTAVCFTD